MLDYNFHHSNKTVSSTGNQMIIQFLSDNGSVHDGFRAYFNYITINQNCVEYLNMRTLVLTSPNYDCSWVISSSMGNTITIKFNTFEVHIKFIT